MTTKVISWLLCCIISILLGIFLGLLLIGKERLEIFGIFSPIIAALIVGLFIDSHKQKNQHLFDLGVNSPLSKLILEKKAEFYEKYVDQLIRIRLWILINGDPTGEKGKEFNGYIHELIQFRINYGKWLSEEDLKKVEKIEMKHISFMADAQKLNFYEKHSHSPEDEEKRKKMIDDVYGALDELIEENGNGYESFFSELKSAMGINEISRMHTYATEKAIQHMDEE